MHTIVLMIEYPRIDNKVLSIVESLRLLATPCMTVFSFLRFYSLTYSTIYTGDTGLRGPIGEAGIPGTKGDQGNN